MSILRRRTGPVLGLLAGLLLVGLVAGCGTRSATVGDDPASSEPPDPATVVSCGYGPGWATSVMGDGVPSDFTARARDVFTDLLDDPEVGGEMALTFLVDGPDTEFRVLRDDGAEVVLGLGRWTDEQGPSDGALVLTLSRGPGGWRPAGGGECRELAPVLEQGATWVELSGPPQVSDDGRRIGLRLSERACTSARDPRPHLRTPTVMETATSVVVSWTATAMTGAADCPGNPIVRESVALSEPLGERTVYDGSVWPPRRLDAPGTRSQ